MAIIESDSIVIRRRITDEDGSINIGALARLLSEMSKKIDCCYQTDIRNGDY